jgi:hypothetical protein
VDFANLALREREKVRAVGAPVFLIAVFPKNEKENLTKAERNALKKRAGTFLKITEQETGYEDTV